MKDKDFERAIKIMVNELLEQLECFADEALCNAVVEAICANQPFDLDDLGQPIYEILEEPEE